MVGANHSKASVEFQSGHDDLHLPRGGGGGREEEGRGGRGRGQTLNLLLAKESPYSVWVISYMMLYTSVLVQLASRLHGYGWPAFPL